MWVNLTGQALGSLESWKNNLITPNTQEVRRSSRTVAQPVELFFQPKKCASYFPAGQLRYTYDILLWSGGLGLTACFLWKIKVGACGHLMTAKEHDGDMLYFLIMSEALVTSYFSCIRFCSDSVYP